MPKVKLNPLVLEIRGSLSDDLVFKRTPEGEIIVSKKPDMWNVKDRRSPL